MTAAAVLTGAFAALGALVVLGLAVWLGYELRQTRRAADSLTGQIVSLRAELESTGGEPRSSSSKGDAERKLHARPYSLSSQAAIRERAEDILRKRAAAKKVEQGGEA